MKMNNPPPDLQVQKNLITSPVSNYFYWIFKKYEAMCETD
jgi:hypothetical protein